MSAAIHVAQQAIQLNALKACGSIIHLEADDFEKLLSTIASPFLVMAEGGVFSTHYKYVLPHKGLTFYCKSKDELRLPPNTDFIRAKSVIVPDL